MKDSWTQCVKAMDEALSKVKPNVEAVQCLHVYNNTVDFT